MTIEIRYYQDDDLDAVIALFTGSVRNVAAAHYGPAQIDAWAPLSPDRDLWAQRLTAKPTFVALCEGDIIGFTDLEPDGHIDMMFVHAEHQGRGAARSLLAHLENQARAQALDVLFTEASITAKPFFQRGGFKVVEAQKVELRGQTFRNYRMVKRLNALP